MTSILLCRWNRWAATCSLLPFLILTAIPPASWASSPPAESPTAIVQATLTDVFHILEDPKLKDPDKLMPRRRLLKQIIGERFDYAEMSKRALAANWTPLTNDQRAEFVELFKAFLSDRYAGKIEGYSGERTEYRSERQEGAYAEVRTRLDLQQNRDPDGLPNDQ